MDIKAALSNVKSRFIDTVNYLNGIEVYHTNEVPQDRDNNNLMDFEPSPFVEMDDEYIQAPSPRVDTNEDLNGRSDEPYGAEDVDEDDEFTELPDFLKELLDKLYDEPSNTDPDELADDDMVQAKLTIAGKAKYVKMFCAFLENTLTKCDGNVDSLENFINIAEAAPDILQHSTELENDLKKVEEDLVEAKANNECLVSVNDRLYRFLSRIDDGFFWVRKRFFGGYSLPLDIEDMVENGVLSTYYRDLHTTLG